MPILRAETKLIFFAHVPKCGGSAVEHYLRARFGPLAFVDSQHLAQPIGQRWTQTSPQHIARPALDRLFPPGFFDHSVAIVRHPVARLVSTYHFQLEQEKSVAANIGFSDWLADLPDVLSEEPFAFDNHIRPMDDLVPQEAHILHLEHGLEGLISWFDTVTGQVALPRAIPRINEQAERKTNKAVPNADDLEQIARIYSADFERFGYRIDTPAPLAAAPDLPADIIAARDAETARYNRPVARLTRQAKRILRP